MMENDKIERLITLTQRRATCGLEDWNPVYIYVQFQIKKFQIKTPLKY